MISHALRGGPMAGVPSKERRTSPATSLTARAAHEGYPDGVHSPASLALASD
jgi:hypothetical protein